MSILDTAALTNQASVCVCVTQGLTGRASCCGRQVVSCCKLVIRCKLTDRGLLLLLAGYTPGMRAAFLVDPVDGTTATASKPGYPSAVGALRGQGKQLGIAGTTRV